MTCDQCLELLSARLDGELAEAEARELEAHMAGCPACRAAGAQLAALQGAFHEPEDVEAPEGFAQGVMDRIQAESPEKKIIPLFKRPQFRALAGLAACAVLAVGLYGTVQRQNAAKDAVENYMMARSFSRDALSEDAAACEVLPTEADAPVVTAYSDPGAPVEETNDDLEREMMLKIAPDADVDYAGADSVSAAPVAAAAVLTVERMPEGGWELISPETPVSPEGLYVTEELLKQVEQLAIEQGITASITSNIEAAEEFVIIVLEGTE